MEDIKAMLDGMVNVMKFDLTLWGYTFSFWEIFLWSSLAVFVVWLIVRFLYE